MDVRQVCLLRFHKAHGKEVSDGIKTERADLSLFAQSAQHIFHHWLTHLIGLSGGWIDENVLGIASYQFLSVQYGFERGRYWRVSALLRTALREDVRLGLRITNYKKRTVVAFEVDEQAAQVAILGLFYGGQDYEAILHDVPETGEYS